MSAHPFFSILVPTYNHAKYIGAALDSLLAQTDPDWEAVVVNDGSTDNTPEVLNRYAQADSRIRVIHKPNGGTGSALNRALSESRGDWICWLSSDDFFDPNKLAIHRSWIARDPGCRFHFTYFRLLIESKGSIEDHQLWGPLPKPEFQVLGLFYRNYVSGISICVHRESWEKVGQFNERLRYAQDYDMWLRLLSRYPGRFIPEWTCTNRNHSGQGSEIFPQACYYDCGAAGVQFLTEHRFEQMFPLLDLSDPASALLAVEYALSHAADESAFLYWYGAHPCLLMRTLEWAWDKLVDAEVYLQREPCRKLARQMIADTVRQLRGTPLGWYWQTADAAITMPEPDFTYTPMRPMDVGLSFLHDQRGQGKTDFPDLHRYFKMQYGIELPSAPKRLARRSVVVCNLDPRSEMPVRDLEIAQALHAAGCRVAVVAMGRNRLHQIGAIPVLQAQSLAIANQLLNALLPTDTIVWSTTPDDLNAFPSKQHYVLPETAEAASAHVERILQGPNASPQLCIPESGPSPLGRRKVVFIGARPWGGGAERVTHELLHALDPDKHELHFVPLFNEGIEQVNFAHNITLHDVEFELKALNAHCNPFHKRILGRCSRVLRILSDFLRRHAPPRVVKQKLNPYLDSIQQLWPHVIALRQIFHRIGPDALLIPVMEEAAVRVWLAQSFSGQPYCVALHTAESKYLPVLYPDPNRLKMESFLLSNACHRASAVTIPSQGCKDDLVDYFNVAPNRVSVMPNPINIQAIMRSYADTPEIPIPPLGGRTLFVHVARLSHEKNHRHLLDACALLQKRNPNFLVLCLGAGELFAQIQRQIHERGLGQHIILLGEVKNPFAYISRAQGLLLTSHFESFALVLVEAMSCGAVPISVDCPYGPREVLRNGKDGLLVPADDPFAFAIAMQRVAEDRQLRATMRESGIKRAREFELADIATQWESLIATVTNEPVPFRAIASPSQFDSNHQTNSKRQQLVFIGRSPWGGGAERATYDLIHGLDAAKYEIHFVHLLNTDRDSQHFDSRITVHSVETELKKRRLHPAALWRRCLNRLSRYLRESSDWLRSNLPGVALRQGLDAYLDSTAQMWPQVVALNDILTRIGADLFLIPVMEEASVRVWLTQALAKRPYCTFLQIAESQYMPILYPSRDRLMIENHFLSSACRAARAVVIPSQGCKDDLIRHYNIPSRAIEVAPNPADIKAILKSSRETPEIPLPDLTGKCLFVHVARLDYQKNHRLLFEACRLSKARGLEFVVVCLGEGKLRAELQREIDNLGLQGTVLLFGEVKNPFAYMARAQGLVLTSRFESFALVLVEAMACGAVPISVDCPHGPREVLDHGRCGLLVPMDDSVAFADAMFRVASDKELRESYRPIGLQRAQNYDLPLVASQWEEIIDKNVTNARCLGPGLDAAA